jgi:small subunit ribosomal protein S16
MVKIRLRRVGAKKQPSYRVVVADSRSARDGRFIEIIGHYDPRTDPPTVVIQEDRALYWLSVGAQPTDSVGRFFEKLELRGKLKAVHSGTPVSEAAGGRVRVSGPAEKVAAPAPAKPARGDKGDKGEKGDKGAKGAKEKAATAETTAGPTAEAAAERAEAAAQATAPAAEAAAETTETTETTTETTETTETTAPTAAATAETSPATADAEPSGETGPSGTPADKTDSAPLSELGLSTRLENALSSAGVETVSDLEAKAAEGDDALLALAGVGDKAVEEIHEKLQEREG